MFCLFFVMIWWTILGFISPCIFSIFYPFTIIFNFFKVILLSLKVFFSSLYCFNLILITWSRFFFFFIHKTKLIIYEIICKTEKKEAHSWHFLIKKFLYILFLNLKFQMSKLNGGKRSNNFIYKGASYFKLNLTRDMERISNILTKIKWEEILNLIFKLTIWISLIRGTYITSYSS